jgi:hypothetical protein
MTEELLEWLWITTAIELVAQYIPPAGMPETPAATAREFLLIELAARRIRYRHLGEPIYRGWAFPLLYFWHRIDKLIEHEISVRNSVIRRGPGFVQATPSPPLKRMNEPDEDEPGTAQSPRELKPDELCWILGSSQQAADVELPLVQLNRDDILRRMQECGYLPLQHKLPLSPPASQETAEPNSTPAKQSVLDPVVQVAEAMAETVKSGSAAAWIIKLHPNDWNVVTAGKIRQEAARKGATLSARAYQHALAKLRRALIQYDKR